MADARSTGSDPALPPRGSKWTVLLLILWFALSFSALFFARDLQFTVAGWPFNYWLAAQGGVLGFIAIVAIHAALMRRVEPDEPPDWPAEPYGDDG